MGCGEEEGLLPDGAVTFNMYEKQTDILSQFGVEWDFNNFSCNGATIADVGEVDGLAEVRNLPQSGWSCDALIWPGYIAASNDVNEQIVFVRIYVVEYVYGSNGNINGAAVSVQIPFAPSNYGGQAGPWEKPCYSWQVVDKTMGGTGE